MAAALKQVQIPAGARHIQIELLEKAPHRIGEYCVGQGGQQGVGEGGRRAGTFPDFPDKDRQSLLVVKFVLTS